MEKENTTREKEIYKVTWIGSFVNLFLFAFKLLAGIFGHSAAMIADAVHSLCDFITDVIVVIFVKLSAKPADATHEYGHGKFETMATFIISVILFGVGLGLLVHAVREIIGFIEGDMQPSPGMLAFWAAVLSMVMKETLYRYTIKEGKKLMSPAVIANAWDHRSDALSSLGTALGIGGAILLGGKWRLLDPLAAGIVSLFIIQVSIKLMHPCLDELLERSLPREVENKILDTILGNPYIAACRGLRTRSIGNTYAIEVKIVMNGEMSLTEAHEKATEVERQLKNTFGKNTHVAVHMEPLKS